ncbi:hypothetical protein ACIQW7_16530 [Peribacillus simplex]|uniref:hypothetical protein n=1 Tax=Peribacillus TaxID=2675229 RepID=UPI00315B119F
MEEGNRGNPHSSNFPPDNVHNFFVFLFSLYVNVTSISGAGQQLFFLCCNGLKRPLVQCKTDKKEDD